MACTGKDHALTPQHAARFWSLVDRSRGRSACWSWLRSHDTTGYGQFAAGGHVHKAHRVAYTLAVGPIPSGYEVKQSCGDRGCVNPAHLLLVSPVEARARLAARHGERTHCPQGHPYDEANTYWWRGMRRCRICQREHGRRGYHRRKVGAFSGNAAPTLIG